MNEVVSCDYCTKGTVQYIGLAICESLEAPSSSSSPDSKFLNFKPTVLEIKSRLEGTVSTLLLYPSKSNINVTNQFHTRTSDRDSRWISNNCFRVSMEISCSESGFWTLMFLSVGYCTPCTAEADKVSALHFSSVKSSDQTEEALSDCLTGRDRWSWDIPVAPFQRVSQDVGETRGERLLHLYHRGLKFRKCICDIQGSQGYITFEGENTEHCCSFFVRLWVMCSSKGAFSGSRPSIQDFKRMKRLRHVWRSVC